MTWAEYQINENLVEPLAQARSAAFQDFVSLAQGNAGALAAAQASPQALGTGFSYTIRDLRRVPDGAWSGAAPMEAALIYYVSCCPDSPIPKILCSASLMPRSFSPSTLHSSAVKHA